MVTCSVCDCDISNRNNLDNCSLHRAQNHMDVDLPDQQSLADYQATMELQNNILLQMNTDIKQEIDNNISDDHEMMNIKSEKETLRPETQSTKDIPDNPFENVQLEIKQEINLSMILETDTTDSENAGDNIETNDSVQNEMPLSAESGGNTVVEVKREEEMHESLVSYDFPSFGDAESNGNENETTDVRSLDSYEATALENVEACLQDEINIKYETEGNYAESDKGEFDHSDVKMESDLTLTDTHLTCNRVSSADIKPTLAFDGLPKDAVVKLPGNTQIGNDNEMLPSYNMDNNTEMNEFHLNAILGKEYEETNNVDDLFQLNSITGNVLSLEQEAYGLLKAKKKMEDKRVKSYVCTECPKAYTSKKGLTNHLSVHRTIERRAMGVIKGLKTRKENQKKSIIEESKKKNIKDLITRKENHKKSIIDERKRKNIQERITRNQKKSIIEERKKENIKELSRKENQKKSIIEERKKESIKELITSKENQKKSIIEETKKKNMKELIIRKENQKKSIIEESKTKNMKELKTKKENHKKSIIGERKKKKKPERYEIVQEVSDRTFEMHNVGVIKGMKIRKENRRKNKKQEEDKETDTREVVSEDQKLSQNKKDGYECTCGMSFRRRSRMETCLRSHNLFETVSSYVSCVTCSKSFRNKDELVSHRKRLHRKRFPCKFCPTDYETRKELFKHLQIHQKVQLIEYKVISEVMKTKQKLRCFMCSTTWSELSELKSHVMNDHREPYICPHCKNTFTKIIDFGNHTKTFHPEVEGQSVLDVLEAFSRLVKAWKCEECELQFLEADKLAMHQIEKHSPELKAEQQFQCTDCRRVFISQKGLTSHRRIHHNTESTEVSKEEVQGIMCLECRKICKDMTALTSHMRLHSPERKFPCKFCEFRFATQEKRKSHAEVHTGDMRYVCFICEYQCSSENRLKQHKMSLKHANMKEYLLTGKPLLEEPQSTYKQEKGKDLKKKEPHVKKKKRDKKEHSEEKKDRKSCTSDSEEVYCDICGDKFSSEPKMLEHKQTHPFIEFPNDDKPSRIFFK